MQHRYESHATLCPTIAGHIDLASNYDDDDDVRLLHLVGWAFHLATAQPRPVRFRADTGGTRILDPVRRDDVGAAYNDSAIAMCGWNQLVTCGGGGVLEMQEEDAAWTPFAELSVAPPLSAPLQQQVGALRSSSSSSRPLLLPSVVVVDDVYADPHAVRAFALAQPFQLHPANHKGERTDAVYLFPGLKELIERRLGDGVRINSTDWTNMGTNGCFQWCKAGDTIVYHTDMQEWAGVLFLTPDAPVQCGTTLFRARGTQHRRVDESDPAGCSHAVFGGGFLDATRFEPVDVIGNVFNRLVIFDARLIHAASQYFGTDAANGRLFQMFFFNLE